MAPRALLILLVLLTSGTVVQKAEGGSDLINLTSTEPPATSPRPSCSGRRCLLPRTRKINGFPTKNSKRNEDPINDFSTLKRIRIVNEHHRCVLESKPVRQALFILKEVTKHVGVPICVNMSYAYPRNFEVFGELRFQMHIQENLEYLYSLEQDDACIIVKRLDPQRESVLQSFSALTWTGVSGCLAMVVVAQRLVGQRNVLFETLRTFISGAFQESNRPTANYVSLLLSVFGLIMAQAFGARFMSFLAVPQEAKQPTTLEQVNSRVTKIYDNLLSLVASNVEEDDIVHKLAAKTVRLSGANVDEASDATAQFIDAAIVISRPIYELLSLDPPWVDAVTGRQLTHLVPQCVLSPAYRTFQVRADWEGRHRFDALMQRAVEAGFLDKFKSIHHHETRLRFALPTPSDEPVPLGLADITQPLLLLAAGAAVAAVVVFFVEIIAHRWQLRRRLTAALSKIQQKITSCLRA